MGWKTVGLVAVVSVAIGFWLGQDDAGDAVRHEAGKAGNRLAGWVLGAAARSVDSDLRVQILAESPELFQALRRGGSFGGKFSAEAARGMFSRDADAIEDVRDKTEIIEIAPGSWQIRFPIVNASLFETEAGLVLVDTGMSPAGPALLEAIREVSDKPLHTVIYTHGHVDHSYGAWALLEAGEEPVQIVAHEKLLSRFDRYLRLRGSMARYMSQPLEHLPQGPEDLVWPTRTFDGERLDLEVGGEKFILYHYPAETDDQLFVWIPGRRILQSADYYQGFLPNAGNGKRVQRYVESWVLALRKMVSLQPQILLPGHGEALTDSFEIQENLTVLADTLEFIVDHSLAGLNRGLRKDEIVGSLVLPEPLANHPTMRVQYVTPQDIAKMVLRQYTGWWNDLPSHWSPAPVSSQGRMVVDLAGGMDRLVERAREWIEDDIRLASQLADYAFLAYPDDPRAQQLVDEVYRARILDPMSNTMEIAAYLDVLTEVRVRQQERK